MTSSMPTCAATVRAVASLSPVSRIGVSPSARSLFDGIGGRRFDRIGNHQHTDGCAIPANHHCRLTFGLRAAHRLVEFLRYLREQPLPADHHVDAIDDASNTQPLEIGEVRCRRQFGDLFPRAGRDCLCNRMFGWLLERTCESQNLVRVAHRRR